MVVKQIPHAFCRRTVRTFFQIGTVRFNSSMAYCTASNASLRCGDDTAMSTLTSPIGQSPSLCNTAIFVTDHCCRIFPHSSRMLPTAMSVYAS